MRERKKEGRKKERKDGRGMRRKDGKDGAREEDENMRGAAEGERERYGKRAQGA